MKKWCSSGWKNRTRGVKMRFYRFLIGITFLGVVFFNLTCGKKEIQRSQDDFVYLSFSIFVFEATQAEEKLEFNPFPTVVSTRVIDQVFQEAEQYFESLKSLSSFNRLMLLKSFTQKMKISKTTPLSIEAVKTIPSSSESGYDVKIIPQQLEQERVQLRVVFEKGGELFFATDVSAPIDKSVVVGRMMEGTQKAILVTSSVEEITDSTIIVSLDAAESPPVSELTKPVILDSKPVHLEYEDPKYPASARREGIEGTVWLRVLVSEKGDVVDVEVLESAHKDLDQAVVKKAWDIKYTPAKSQGKPVPVWRLYSVTFNLD
jgi:TonB family protein